MTHFWKTNQILNDYFNSLNKQLTFRITSVQQITVQRRITCDLRIAWLTVFAWSSWTLDNFRLRTKYWRIFIVKHDIVTQKPIKNPGIDFRLFGVFFFWVVVSAVGFWNCRILWLSTFWQNRSPVCIVPFDIIYQINDPSVAIFSCGQRFTEESHQVGNKDHHWYNRELADNEENVFCNFSVLFINSCIENLRYDNLAQGEHFIDTKQN